VTSLDFVIFASHIKHEIKPLLINTPPPPPLNIKLACSDLSLLEEKNLCLFPFARPLL